ncbi:ATP-binding protein [Shewanella benthica]|nr:ATP-binding protein [Shewanella benthica]
MLTFTSRLIKSQIDRKLTISTILFSSLITLITTNIISNAYTHTFKKVDKCIIIRAKLVDNNINISIQDNASGISRDAATHIFEPFYTTSRNEGGTGLGLSAAYNAAILLKGNISFEPKCELGGACFLISFPLLPTQTSDEHTDAVSA